MTPLPEEKRSRKKDRKTRSFVGQFRKWRASAEVPRVGHHSLELLGHLFIPKRRQNCSLFGHRVLHRGGVWHLFLYY